MAIKKYPGKAISIVGRILIEFVEKATVEALNLTEDFIFSYGSSKTLAQNVYSRISQEQYRSAFHTLQRSGYIKKVNEDQFLITPKAMHKIKTLEIENSEWDSGEWDSNWKIIAFDIPEYMAKERNMLRSIIKRKGFIGIQNSVFVAPFADFKQLAELRKELKIDKYVSFFDAKSAESDDDILLRKKFGLK